MNVRDEPTEGPGR